MRQILARVLFVLSILSVSIGSSNENCVWNYKCCSFGEVNGQNSCVKMCEPEIKCEASDVETFKETDAEHEHEALRTVCRSGFQYYNGRCRRVFGRTREKIWDEIKISSIVYSCLQDFLAFPSFDRIFFYRFITWNGHHWRDDINWDAQKYFE